MTIFDPAVALAPTAPAFVVATEVLGTPNGIGAGLATDSRINLCSAGQTNLLRTRADDSGKFIERRFMSKWNLAVRTSRCRHHHLCRGCDEAQSRRVPRLSVASFVVVGDPFASRRGRMGERRWTITGRPTDTTTATCEAFTVGDRADT